MSSFYQKCYFSYHYCIYRHGLLSSPAISLFRVLSNRTLRLNVKDLTTMPRVSVQLNFILKLPGSADSEIRQPVVTADMTERITHLLSLFRQPSWSACTAVLYGKQLRREQAELNINWQFSCLSCCIHTDSHTKLGETMSAF